MIQKTIEDWVEQNHIPTINTDGYLMASKEDLTKRLVKYKTEVVTNLDMPVVSVSGSTLSCDCPVCGKEMTSQLVKHHHCKECKEHYTTT